jgi:hypothetical protein
LGDYKEDRHEFQVSRVGRKFNLEDGLIILDLMQKPCNRPKERATIYNDCRRNLYTLFTFWEFVRRAILHAWLFEVRDSGSYIIYRPLQHFLAIIC